MPHGQAPDADRAWQELLSGNRRFAAGACRHPRQSVARRAEIVAGQHPFAVVVGCADSRVPPEILFDCGLGDLFVLRDAGNVLDEVGEASLEYAVEHLAVRLVVVLGHSGCGALTAVIEGAPVEGHLVRLVEHLQPAVARASARPGDVLDNAVVENIRSEVARLRRLEPVLAGLVASGQVRVVGARYDLSSGLVTAVE
jgi:carbonic anhydrase